MSPDVEVVKTKTRLRELLATSQGCLYSDTWRTLHRKRCGSTKTLKPTGNPTYDFTSGQDWKYGLSRGVVAYFPGSLETSEEWLELYRGDPKDHWKHCKSCDALVKQNPNA